MKKLLLILPILALILAGCGKADRGKVIVGDVANTYNAAQELNQDMNDPNKISSEENVENIYTIMNYQGSESKEIVKTTIKEGIEAGKKQDELDKDLIRTAAANDSGLGTGYMLGYIFGCKAVTGNEDKCNDDMGEKYQAIMVEEMQQQFQNMTATQ
ncbi:MAG: hypothetical protein WC473_00045 [Patescibacteria group bacterium]|jgi:hypothetical protein